MSAHDTTQATDGRTRFVGRRSQLGQLDGLLDHLLDGRGAVALLSGDPGIGKTRLVEELAALATERGVTVAWGRCTDAEGAPALWPWQAVLRRLLATLDDDIVAAAAADAPADVGRVLPELTAQLAPAVDDSGTDPAQARFRLLEGLTGLLGRCAGERPTLVLLEDLHWADAPSLLLAERVASELTPRALLLVATFRDVGPDHPLQRSLGVLARAPRLVRVELRGLDAAATQELVEGVLQTDTVDGLAQDLWQRADGNPLFVIEMARFLAAAGGERARAPVERGDGGGSGAAPAVGAGEGAVLPPTVVEVIGRRIAQLSDPCRELLQVAAVVGREVDVDLLAAVTGRSVDDVLDALDEAEAARLLRAGSAPGQVTVTHALVGDAIVGALSVARRTRLHRRIAAALEERYAADLDAACAELAWHRSRAGGSVDREAALRYAEQAAAVDARVRAFERAAAHLELALTLVEDRRHRAQLLLRLGEMLNHAGELERSTAVFDEAAAIARGLGAGPGDPEAARLLAEAAMGASVIAVAAGQRAEQVLLIEEALHALGASEPRLRVRLLSRLAGALVYTDRTRRRDELLEEALVLARSIDDAESLGSVLSVLTLTLWRPEQLRRRGELAEEAARVAAATGNPDLLVEPGRLRVMSLVDRGDLGALDTTLADHRRLCDTLHLGVHRWRSIMWRTMRLLLAGRFDEVEASMAEAAAEPGGAHHPDAFLWFAAQTLLLRREQGLVAEMIDALRAFADGSPQMVIWRCVLAALIPESADVTAMTGALTGEVHDAVRAEVDRVAAFLGEADDPLQALLSRAEGLPAAAFLAEAVVALGDEALAAPLLGALRPYAGHGVMIGPAIIWIGVFDHRLGQLAATVGELAEAEQWFDRARRRYVAMGAEPWLARLGFDEGRSLGRLALRRRDPALARRAVECLDRSVAHAAVLGMARLGADAAAAAAALADLAAATAPPEPVRAAATRTRPTADADERRRHATLTGRERDVLRLMAEGYSNPEIGATLYLSAKTVMHHAASIYRKLGVRGRTEAAALHSRVVAADG